MLNWMFVLSGVAGRERRREGKAEIPWPSGRSPQHRWSRRRSTREASAAAAGGATPLDIALKIVGPFEGSTQHIIQANEGSEAPVRSRSP